MSFFSSRSGRGSAARSRHWCLIPAEAIAFLCLAMVVIQLLWSLLNLASNYIFVKIGLESLLRLRTELYAHLQRLSLKFHDTRRSADSSFRVAYDSQSIQTIYNKGFTNIIGSGVTLIGTFASHAAARLATNVAFPCHRAATPSARSISLPNGFGSNPPPSRNRKVRCSRRRRKD